MNDSTPGPGTGLGTGPDTITEVLNLGRGYPTPALLPVGELREVMAELSDERVLAMLEYGNPGGPMDLRRDLAAFLSVHYGHGISADELMLASGISLNLSMVCQILAPPGATVVCEDPTYFHACNIFGTAGVRMHGVAMDAHGMRVDVLERALERDGLRPAIVYTIPSFHNPTSINLDPTRAERLVELAAAYDFYIVADEPYLLLHFDDAPPPCMMSYDRGRARVISLGSFTKLLAPGLRAGWIHAHPTLIERVIRHGALLSGGGLNPVAYAAIHHTLGSGFLAANISRLRTVYGERARAMSQALASHFGAASFVEPRGGYFLWLELPPECEPERLNESAQAQRVSFMPGARCAIGNNGGNNADSGSGSDIGRDIGNDIGRRLRLCFAYYNTDALLHGVERLAKAVHLAGRATR